MIMNYFNKKNIFIWILIVLMGINIAALVTIILRMNTINNRPNMFEHFREPRSYFKQRFKLQDDELEWFTARHKNFRETVLPRVKDLRSKNNEIFLELTSKNPDTALLYQYSEKLGNLTVRLNRKTIDHFLNLLSDADSTQREIIKEIVQEIFSHGPPPFTGKNPEERFHKRHKNRERK